MPIKIAAVLALHQTLTELVSHKVKYQTKFNYAAMRNLRTIEPIVETFQKATNPFDAEKWPELVEFEAGRVTMLEALCRKDDSGKPVMVGQDYSIPAEVDLTVAFAELKKQFPGVDEVSERHNEERMALLNQEEEVKLFMVKLEYLPVELEVGLTLNLLPMIQDEE
jgi:hypothetical protein